MKTRLLLALPSVATSGLATIDTVGMSPSVGGVVVGLSSSTIEAFAVPVPITAFTGLLMFAAKASLTS